jgi:hypothetical protein
VVRPAVSPSTDFLWGVAIGIFVGMTLSSIIVRIALALFL